MRVLSAVALVLAWGCAGSNAPPPGEAPPGTGPTATNPAPAAAPAPVEQVGPDGPAALAVPSVSLSEDPTVVARGKEVFDGKGCGACHQFGTKLVGPDLKGVTARRSPTWLARMIRYPELMTKQDPVARDLFRTHMVQMTDQGVPEADLAPLLSYIHVQGK